MRGGRRGGNDAVAIRENVLQWKHSFSIASLSAHGTCFAFYFSTRIFVLAKAVGDAGEGRTFRPVAQSASCSSLGWRPSTIG